MQNDNSKHRRPHVTSHTGRAQKTYKTKTKAVHNHVTTNILLDPTFKEEIFDRKECTDGC